MGNTTDNGNRLQVNGTGYFAGSLGVGTATTLGRIHAVGLTANSSDNVMYLENAVASVLFRVRNDGYLQSPTTYNNTTASPNYLSISSSGYFERYVASSARYKEEIKDWDEIGLNIILALRPKTYKYKKEYYNKADVSFLGLIAEEVAEVNPYLADFENEDGSGQVENVRYATIVVPLIKAIQEQQAQIQSLQEQQATIKVLQEAMEKIETLEAKVTALENK